MELADWPLEELAPEDLSRLGSLAERRGFAEGQRLIAAGEPASGLFLLVAGSCRVTVERRGREVEVSRVAPGALLGEMSLVSGDAASASVTAATPCETHWVPRDALDRSCREDPAFSARLYRGLSRVIGERLRAMNAALTGHSPPDTDAGVAWADALLSTRGIDLPRYLLHWIARYAAIGYRGTFTWKWYWRGLQETEMPFLVPEWSEHTRGVKLLTLVLVTLLEELAARSPGDAAFEQARARLTPADAGPTGRSPEMEARLAGDLWQVIHDRAGQLPGWSGYAALWEFDLGQVVQSLAYPRLLARLPEAGSPVEAQAHLAHVLPLTAFAALDLMTAGDPPERLGDLREALFHAQLWGRLGTALATWRRDAADGKLDGLVLQDAVRERILSRTELSALPAQEIVAKLETAGIEARLAAACRDRRTRLEAAAERTGFLDPTAYLRGVESFFAGDMAARGYL